MIALLLTRFHWAFAVPVGLALDILIAIVITDFIRSIM